jgi:hypothetical protein
MTLKKAGLSLESLSQMDKETRKKTLKGAGLNPKSYQTIRIFLEETQFVQPPAESEDPPVEKTEIYRYCTVVFHPGERGYAYRTEDKTVLVGDYVLVPAGADNAPELANVASVGEYTAEAAPYPVEKTKTILRKATRAESALILPQTATAAAPQEDVKKEPTKEPARPQPTYVPTKTQNHSPAWWIVALAAVFAIIVLAGQSSGSSTTRSTSSTYSYTRSTSTGSSRSYSSTYSSTPTCPPVNREKAMTKEEADRLRGTGYHGTRPNSSAEDIELKAAQTKCKNCGYRTHNGVNSLCDYCRWMEQYGGGLPKNTAATPAPKATPRATPKPTEKPKESDPYHASDYSYPEDFYEDYYDDFWDYEDAEEYWERYH